MRASVSKEARAGAVTLAGALLVALAVVALLPVLAVVGWVARAAIVVAAPLVVGVLLSPRGRAWLTEEPEAWTRYKGLRVPHSRLLSRSHAWARARGPRTVRVGVDELLQRALGPVHRVTFAPIGASVAENDPLFILHSGARSVAVRAPVAGTVERVNRRLARRPSRMDGDPWTRGWAVDLRHERGGPPVRVIEPPDPSEWFRADVDRLLSAAGAGGMATAADGGAISADLHAALDDATWAWARAELFGDPSSATGEGGAL